MSGPGDNEHVMAMRRPTWGSTGGLPGVPAAAGPHLRASLPTNAGSGFSLFHPDGVTQRPGPPRRLGGWLAARRRRPTAGRLGPSRRGGPVPCQPRGLGPAHRGGGRALDEGPDFLGDGAPVGGGGQLAEHREQAEVDALEDHVGPRDADVVGDRAAQVEETAHDRGGVVAGNGHWPWFADGVVEDGHVLDDRLGAERRAPAQESGVLQAEAERLGVVLDADGAGHVDERLQFAGAEVPDEPEVEEGDLAAALEQVIARVRIAVEGAHVVQAAEDEAVDRLSPGHVRAEARWL